MTRWRVMLSIRGSIGGSIRRLVGRRGDVVFLLLVPLVMTDLGPSGTCILNKSRRTWVRQG